MIKSADDFVRLRSSECSDEYRRAAEEEAPLAVWMEVIARFPDMRHWVAQNKTVPIEALASLARDPDGNVRRWVAGKRKLSEELFLLLAQDDDETVRAAIAMNKKAPLKVLGVLCDDRSAFVRSRARARFS